MNKIQALIRAAKRQGVFFPILIFKNLNRFLPMAVVTLSVTAFGKNGSNFRRGGPPLLKFEPFFVATKMSGKFPIEKIKRVVATLRTISG